MFWFCRDKLFNNVSAGANPNATKALVIITDGDPSDNDYYNVVNKSDEQNILRYIIGVSFCQKMYSLNARLNVALPYHQFSFFYDVIMAMWAWTIVRALKHLLSVSIANTRQ